MDLSRVTRGGLVAPVPIDPTGVVGPTQRQAQGPEWRRTSKGRYVPAYVDPDLPAQRIVEAAAVLPEDGAITGWAGLHWAGGRWFDGCAPDGRSPLPVPLAVGRNRVVRARSGLIISEEWVDPAEVIDVDGLRVTDHARSVCFEIRRSRTLVRAVTIFDMAAFSDLVSGDQVREHASRYLAGRPHVSRIGKALAFAAENAWSPREVSMRIAWEREGGLPRPLCNVPIFGPDGAHLFTPDLFDPDNGVVGEYDGLVHLEDGRRVRDVNREELVRDLGLELVMMVSADNADREAFLSRLRSAYRRARARRRTSSWTLDQPAWWVDTATVAKRRALTAEQRTTWLKRQVA